MNPAYKLKDKVVAVYARYSSANQREASIDDQLRRCKAFIEQHGGEVRVDMIFTDSAVSGASTQRRGFEQMMALAYARPPRVDVIVTEDMSRITRDFADAAQIFQRLKFQQVPLVGVADGIDTSAKGSKIAFTIKALLSDMYLEELSDKTLRGLEGRALAGFSTGGLPIGYKSEPVTDGEGRCIGHRVLIDEERAAVVRRIFEMYRDGLSYEAIVKQFNREQVPPARRGKYRRKGWVASSVRAILYNPAYIGEWSFKKRAWKKVPGTNARRPQERPDEEILKQSFPDRRIISQRLWDDVHERLAAVNACYTKRPDGAPKGRAVSGKQNNYLLSGLLRCGVCGAPMTIHAGSNTRYYRCSDQKKRGTCPNPMTVREDVARTRVLGVVMERLRSPAAIDRMRKRVVQKLAELSRGANDELLERRARLARVEEKIAGLIDFISKGERSDYIIKTLKDLEAQASSEKKAIADLLEKAAQPIELPAPEFFLNRAQLLADVFEKEPLRGREILQRMFVGGELRLFPRLEGYYVAEGQYSPLSSLSIPLGGDEKSKAPHWRGFREDLWSRDGCAGRI